MLHEPSSHKGRDLAVSYKSKLGIKMFIFYALFYGSFVAINLITPALMGKIVFAGLNLATVFGFALIIVALIEALIYDAMCRKKEIEMEKANSEDEE